MKSKMKFKRTVVGSIVCLSMILSISSCAGDGFDEETFSGGVKNTQLESPDASKVEFTKIPGTTNVKVSWPVIMGAGGYLFSMYNVTDPANSITLVKDSVIDGCQVACPFDDDINYLVEVRTMGNEKLNNKEAATSSQAQWSTIVAATSVPEGVDLTTYFAQNPPTNGSGTEVAFELAAGANYTMSGDIDFGDNFVQLRSADQKNHAKVTITDGSIITCGGGLGLKFIDFDCKVSGGKFIKFGSVPDALKTVASQKDYGVVTNPVIIKSCNIEAGNNQLISTNGKAYAIANLIIKDCVFALNQTQDLIDFNSGSSIVNDLEISNSTFYSTSQSGKYFMRYGGKKGTDFGWTKGSMKYISNTFYNIAYSKDLFNGNSWKVNTNSVTLSKNIFMNTSQGQVNKKITMSSNTVSKSCDNNFYWYPAKTVEAVEKEEITNSNYGDANGLVEDPGFANAAEGNFRPSNANVLSRQSGDPRWLK